MSTFTIALYFGLRLFESSLHIRSSDSARKRLLVPSLIEQEGAYYIWLAAGAPACFVPAYFFRAVDCVRVH
jgi:hypothetical protein